MARYIDAEKMLVTAVKDKKFIFTKEDALKDEVVVKTVYGDLAEFINSQPTADVVEVKHGEWEIKTDDYDCEYMKCSVCKEEFYPSDADTVDTTPNYCPNCGADMRGETDAKL